MHRLGSFKPFIHQVNSKSFSLFQDLEIKSNNQIGFTSSSEAIYKELLNEYNAVKDRLLLIEYFTVADYLYLLQEISVLLRPFKRNLILFLAAAVSDFYLSDRFISEHKICSDQQTELQLRLSPVPKLINVLKRDICPEAFIVSFKLETVENLVVKKAQESLKKYGHDLVVANCLATRKHRVILVSESQPEKVIEMVEGSGNIEIDLVREVIQIYSNMN